MVQVIGLVSTTRGFLSFPFTQLGLRFHRVGAFRSAFSFFPLAVLPPPFYHPASASPRAGKSTDVRGCCAEGRASAFFRIRLIAAFVLLSSLLFLALLDSAFFGLLRLLRAFHATTLHQTAKRRPDHMQQPADWHRALQSGPRPIDALQQGLQALRRSVLEVDLDKAR